MDAARCPVFRVRAGVSMTSLGRFLLVGCANTAIGYGAILFLQYFLSAGHMTANAIGYLIGGAVSYLLNKSFTFRSARAHSEALPRFVSVVASCYLINLLVLEVSVSQWQFPAAIAQGLAVLSYVLSFYVLSRQVVFRDHPRSH